MFGSPFLGSGGRKTSPEGVSFGGRGPLVGDLKGPIVFVSPFLGGG